MHSMFRLWRAFSPAIAGFILLTGMAALAQQPSQTPGAIRVRIAMVPLDVRVVDRQGNPVTDLKQEDFTLFEDDVRQEIRHFSTQALVADSGGRGSDLPLRKAPGPEISASNARVFLIMLGRGRHQAVVGAVDALLAFVRERLLPQDRIAVMAWNRATDFTTDHKLIARIVAQYGEGAEAIETDLREWFTGLRAIYGSKATPRHIQRRIDAVFSNAESLRPRELPPGHIADDARLRADTRRTTDDLLTSELGRVRVPESKMTTDRHADRTAELVGLDFDTYAAQASDTFQDLGLLYAGIEYLRHLDGEKHLVLFTENGLRLSRREDNINLANAASDARIALDTVHTGGTLGAAPPRFDGRGGVVMQPLPTPAAAFRETFSVEDLRTISELTGGRASAFRKGSDALDRIDRSTRFQYLLGYSPINTNWDGKFRKVTVKVTRPDVTVLYRHGFYASEQLVPFDRRQFVTAGRIYQAGRYGRALDDIKLTLKAPRLTGTDAARDLVLEMHVDLSRVALTRTNDRYIGKLDLAVFLGDAKDGVVGETWRAIDLNLTEATRDRLTRDGTAITVTIPAPSGARAVKVVVYDYGADLLGTATRNIR